MNKGIIGFDSDQQSHNLNFQALAIEHRDESFLMKTYNNIVFAKCLLILISEDSNRLKAKNIRNILNESTELKGQEIYWIELLINILETPGITTVSIRNTLMKELFPDKKDVTKDDLINLKNHLETAYLNELRRIIYNNFTMHEWPLPEI